MSVQQKPKLYLAGPEVFLPNATEMAEKQRQLCEKYGFIGLHPMDNNINLSDQSMQTARADLSKRCFTNPGMQDRRGQL